MKAAGEEHWSAVNRTAQTVAALRRLEQLIHGEQALIRDHTLARLLEHDRFEHDHLAGIAIPPACGGELAAIAAWLRDPGQDDNALRLARHVDRLALRTAKIDALLADFLREVPQLVIVGAGLDTRAYHLAATAGSTVFEVDFPHVLAFKHARLGGLPLACRARRTLGCDIAAADLDVRLAAVGFTPDLPTVWLVEGVLVYLSAAQITTLNTSLSTLSARGSRLLATFMGEQVQGMFTAGMISRFDDGPALLARYGWRARQIPYTAIAREYGRDYPADYHVYLAITAPRT